MGVPLTAFTAEAVAALGGPAWLTAARRAAFERFAAASLPTEAEEVWRYSRISELELEAFAPLPGGDLEAAASLPAPMEGLLAALGPCAGLIVVPDGGRAQVIGGSGGFDVVDPGEEELPLGAVAGEPDAFVALNTAFAPAPLGIRVRPGTVLPEPVVVVHWVEADRAAVFPRTVVQVGAGSQATVVEVVASPDIVSLVVPVTELDVDQAANLQYLNVQLLGSDAWQIGLQASRVGRDATLTSASVSLGGDYARVRTDSALVGRGGTSRLLALYFGDGRQMHDFRTMQAHEAPKTTSDLLFKGAVAGTAHSVYSGLIRVRKGAVGTNAFQTNRNLVLSEGAHADSVPNLEIEENDVRCSHASAVGPVDEEQRFYLESRGVPPGPAERLIVLGFLEDVLARTPVPTVHDWLRLTLAAKLEANVVSAP
jgi:Fe-S cluster assembly protein SufD